MERLTKRAPDWEAAVDCGNCGSIGPCTAIKCRKIILEQLAAYEDTNLTPDEIRAMRDDFLEYQAAKQALGGHTWSWLLQVLKEGRVRVIPAKPGTMYRSKRGEVVELTAIHITSAPRQMVVYEGERGLNACDEVFFRRNFTKEEVTP